MKAARTFIIAEAGVNHNGKLSLAKQLIDAAKKAGADAVKFQTFHSEALVTSSASKADYQKKRTAKGKTMLAMLKELELSRADHVSLINYCHLKKILFLSTPFDEVSAALLDELGVKIFKISSGDITNLPFLKWIAGMKRPIILSTGMSTLNEVRQAVRCIFSAGNKRLTLLHCVSDYPAPFKELNLRAMGTLSKEFGLAVGFSDHSPGILIAPVAVALGASVIEKHLTLDRSLQGPDHWASIEPGEFKQMVSDIRCVEQSLGDGQKVMAFCEANCRFAARKSLTAGKAFVAGETISKCDIVIKRPGNGISPAELSKVAGRRAACDIARDETLTWEKIR